MRFVFIPVLLLLCRFSGADDVNKLIFNLSSAGVSSIAEYSDVADLRIRVFNAFQVLLCEKRSYEIVDQLFQCDASKRDMSPGINVVEVQIVNGETNEVLDARETTTIIFPDEPVPRNSDSAQVSRLYSIYDVATKSGGLMLAVLLAVNMFVEFRKPNPAPVMDVSSSTDDGGGDFKGFHFPLGPVRHDSILPSSYFSLSPQQNNDVNSIVKTVDFSSPGDYGLDNNNQQAFDFYYRMGFTAGTIEAQKHRAAWEYFNQTLQLLQQQQFLLSDNQQLIQRETSAKVTEYFEEIMNRLDQQSHRQSERMALLEQKERLERDIEEAKEKLHQTLSRNAEDERILHEKESELHDAKHQLEKMNSELTEAQEQVSVLEHQLHNLTALESDLLDVKDQLQMKQAEIMQLTAEIEELKRLAETKPEPTIPAPAVTQFGATMDPDENLRSASTSNVEHEETILITDKELHQEQQLHTSSDETEQVWEEYETFPTEETAHSEKDSVHTKRDSESDTEILPESQSPLVPDADINAIHEDSPSIDVVEKVPAIETTVPEPTVVDVSKATSTIPVVDTPDTIALEDADQPNDEDSNSSLPSSDIQSSKPSIFRRFGRLAMFNRSNYNVKLWRHAAVGVGLGAVTAVAAATGHLDLSSINFNLFKSSYDADNGQDKRGGLIRGNERARSGLGSRLRSPRSDMPIGRGGIFTALATWSKSYFGR